MLALLLAATLNVGEPAPPLATQLLRAPAGAAANWHALRGKAVVLEFWATWCGPCIERIPHWNALAESFRGRPVEFIAISYEAPDTVKAFLEQRPMSGWVALDPSGETFEAYGVESVPQSVLVDAEGVVRGITHPQQLSSATVEELLAGRKLALAPQPGAG